MKDLREIWPILVPDERFDGFRAVNRSHVESFFLSLRAEDQLDILIRLPETERRFWTRFLPVDAVADIIQTTASPEQREEVLHLLDDQSHREVISLLAYAEDDAGGLMNPEFIRLRPDMGVDEAITYVKKQTRDHVRSVFYLYVLDSSQKLLGVLPFRDLLSASPEKKVHEIMRGELVTAKETMDQEEIGQLFRQHAYLAIPVVDDNGVMKGIVTADKALKVAEEEATEDIQKMGGTEVLDSPYFETGFFKMFRKRGGWLTLLFAGEMLTATAMGFFQDEISRAVVLALFIPLIISSGGNSGSQACTLIIRAMALKEVRLRDWLKVFGREIGSGIALGGLLAAIGWVRIILWPAKKTLYGEHYVLVGTTVALSLIGVVLWGSLMGSMLPFILRRAGFDPASASAPLVATLVDVTGLIIYFSVAKIILGGILL